MTPANVVALADFEPRPETVTEEAFRHVMRELACGVVLVTGAFEGRRAGCAVSSIASLSLKPTSLLVCLNDGSTTLRTIRAGGAFAINILASHHQHLARRFAAANVRGEQRFAEGEWDASVAGLPHLRDALAILDCRLERIVEHATHAIVIGACVAVAKREPAPALVHWRGRFETLA